MATILILVLLCESLTLVPPVTIRLNDTPLGLLGFRIFWYRRGLLREGGTRSLLLRVFIFSAVGVLALGYVSDLVEVRDLLKQR